MITLNRPSNYTNIRSTELAGRSIDTKPVDVENGSMYTEIDTGRTYRFDAENKVWIEHQSTPVSSGDMKVATYDPNSTIANAGGIANYVANELADYVPNVRTVNDKALSDDVELTADDVGALATTGGVVSGRVQIDAALGMSVFTEDGDNTGTVDIYPQTADSTDRLKITPSGIGAAIPGHDVYLYGANVQLKASEGVTDAVGVKNVAAPTENGDAANKKYVDDAISGVSATCLLLTGGTLTGDLTIAPEGRTSIITATMGSGANIIVKENDNALTMMTFNPPTKSIILADGTTQDPITIRGVAEPQVETDAVNKKYIEETYGTKEGSATFKFPGVWKVKNVASPGEEHDGANKYYVDHKIIAATHTIHSLSLDAGATHTEQVSVVLPTGITSVEYDFYATVSGNNLAALLSVTKTEAVASSSGSWLRTTYLAYNPGTAAVTGDVNITVLCISK